MDAGRRGGFETRACKSHHDSSLQRINSVAIGGIADIGRGTATPLSDAIDPMRSKAGSKYCTAANPDLALPIGYAVTTSWLGAAHAQSTQTTRLHHAARRRGGVAARSARAAAAIPCGREP